MRTNKINNFIYGLLAVFTLTLTSCDKDFLEKPIPVVGVLMVSFKVKMNLF